MARSRKDRRGKNGGARPGCGRKMLDHERMQFHISRETRVKLDRFARTIGMSREERKGFWEKVLTALLGKVDLPEPEYLTLARAITVRSVR